MGQAGESAWLEIETISKPAGLLSKTDYRWGVFQRTEREGKAMCTKARFVDQDGKDITP